MFAALEARMNRVAMAKLANATAIIPGQADPVPVIFDAEYRPGMIGVVGMGSSDPQLTISSDVLPPDFDGTPITVNGVAWTVAGCRPDGMQVEGLTVVILEKA